MAQMIPMTRFYTDRSKIFDHFKEHFKSFEEFSRLNAMNESVGAEKYSKIWFVPGTLFAASPHQLKDAVAVCTLVLGPTKILGTRSSMLFHFNYKE